MRNKNSTTTASQAFSKAIGLAMILAISLIVLTGCGKESTAITPLLPREVEVMSIAAADLEKPITKTGSFSYKEKAVLSFEIGGVIQNINFTENIAVAKGALLASLPTTDISYQKDLAQNQLIQAQLQLEIGQRGADTEQITIARSQLAEAELIHQDLKKQYEDLASLYQAGAIPERQLKDLALKVDQVTQQVIQARAALTLLEKGLTPQELSLLETQVQQAEIQVAQINQLLTKANLEAPFNGVVLKKLASLGELVGPGQPVAILADPDSLVFSFGITSEELAYFTVGQSVNISFNSQEQVTGAIESIFLTPDQTTRLYQVEIPIDKSQSDKIFPGTIGQVAVSFSTGANHILLPPQAVVSRKNEQFVFILTDDNTVLAKSVVTGSLLSGQLKILSGLEIGQQVVLTGATFLQDGEAVRIKGSDSQ
ncbi:MAG: efflux RND transporter periplasmic adaptor subunit [Bacillota bacterium]|nr:efflux RND transporter periplasmic adaptor subunit [Bacillota bacterium]